MHIADGILSPEVCLGAAALAACGVAVSVKRLDQAIALRTVPVAGMIGALVFAGQMVKFPLLVVPAYGHLLGGVLAAVLAGPWGGCLAITLVVLMQLLLFADGGWLAAGANVLNMAVVGSLGGYALYSAVRRRFSGSTGVVVGAVAAAWVSVVAASALFCVEFALSHPAGLFDLPLLFSVMTSVHSLVGVGEALITGGIVSFVVARRPDLIYTPETMAGSAEGFWRAAWAGVVVALAVAAFVAPFASEGADGLEAVAERLNFDSLEQPTSALVPGGYEMTLPGVDSSTGYWQKLSVALAGVLGSSAVFGMALVFGRVSRPVQAAGENADAG